MNQEPTIFLGGLESPVDPRDFVGTGIAPIEIPAVYLPDNSSFPVYNQVTPPPGAETACGGASGTKLQSIKSAEKRRLSFRALFAWTTKISGIPPEQGTYGRAIMQALQTYGIPLESLHPNDNTLSIKDFADPTKISPAARIDALSRRIGPFAQITDLSMAGLKQAIAVNGAVLVLKSPWTPASWTPTVSGTGHFFVLDGYDLSRIRFCNSFGADWHDQGDGWLESSDLASIKEAWVVWELPPTKYLFTRDLTIGSTGEDVRMLQRFLNSHDARVAYIGAGSPGNETSTFGTLTQAALAKFQTANGISPAAGYFGPITRARVNAM